MHVLDRIRVNSPSRPDVNVLMFSLVNNANIGNGFFMTHLYLSSVRMNNGTGRIDVVLIPTYSEQMKCLEYISVSEIQCTQ